MVVSFACDCKFAWNSITGCRFAPIKKPDHKARLPYYPGKPIRIAPTILIPSTNNLVYRLDFLSCFGWTITTTITVVVLVVVDSTKQLLQVHLYYCGHRGQNRLGDLTVPTGWPYRQPAVLLSATCNPTLQPHHLINQCEPVVLHNFERFACTYVHDFSRLMCIAYAAYNEWHGK